MKRHVATTWLDLVDALFVDSWNASLGKFRSPYYFRGLDEPYRTPLQTGFQRLENPNPKIEKNLLRNFRKYAHSTAACDTEWDWLALAQHHGLPTRLLDWTASPLAAMHFATADQRKRDKDGVVWAVDCEVVHRLLPSPLRKLLALENAFLFTGEMLATAAATLWKFDRLASRQFFLFFEPPSIDSRIVNQYALFSVMNGAGHSMESYLRAVRGAARIVIIPASLKREVRDKLDNANVTERMLFPGLDGLSTWLARYYAPPPKKASGK